MQTMRTGGGSSSLGVPSDKTAAIYAASDATFIEALLMPSPTPPPAMWKAGKVYWLLTPDLWAWFARKFDVACRALERGMMDEAVFVELLDRIGMVYQHALDRFGKEALDEAKKTVDPKAWDSKIHYENEKVKFLQGRGVAGDGFKETPEPKTEQTALAF